MREREKRRKGEKKERKRKEKKEKMSAFICWDNSVSPPKTLCSQQNYKRIKERWQNCCEIIIIIILKENSAEMAL